MSDIAELKPIPTYWEMPECEATFIGPVRWAVYDEIDDITVGLHRKSAGNYPYYLTARLEGLYEDGWEHPFWGPIPTVEWPELEQPK